MASQNVTEEKKQKFGVFSAATSGTRTTNLDCKMMLQ
jgi:hypothetical protein